uniref:Venom peptide 7.1 n=1 Tax=Tityus serrulatus TaxID=6887 RepID=NDB4V_TITSE|nr:RecName: Full=Venom peptide 7.1; AltName: Full=Venom peptide 7; Contains: RecName: Full=Venom peptide 7.2 [Tityus serrulatus]
RLRSKGKK